MGRRVIPFDRKAMRHMLRFGELEASLADADLAQLHDTLTRLHGFPDPTVQRLCAQLRQLLDNRDNEGTGSTLQLDAEAARKVQLAVYCDQAGRKPVSPPLAHARRQAFLYLESEQH